jgi:hypothetical protein
VGLNRYGAPHRRLRRALLPMAVGSPCTRCGRTLTADDLVDLDHTDDGAGYLGWSHRTCNRRAGALKGNRLRAIDNRRSTPMSHRCALGVDISFSREFTSAVFAVEMPDAGLVVVELEYLPGSDTSTTIANLAASRPNLVATVIDPRSPATTLLAPLAALGVTVTEPATRDIALGHGLFLDELRAGRLRYVDHEALTAAMQHAVARPLAGSQALERQRVEGDASPLTAAELAVWGLLAAPRPVDVTDSVW